MSLGLQRWTRHAHRRGVRPDDLSDADVLSQARVRPDLMGVVYERHARSVHRYLSRRVGTAAADDLLGDVFVAAVEARQRVQPHPSGSALPWLYGIAGNLVRSSLRRSSTQAAPIAVPGFDWDAVDDRLDATARRHELRTALASLTEAERELLLLVAWEGLSPAEAGEALGLTAVAARSRLHRARTRAQAALDLLASADARRT
jgi:RNA polymerase sigma-70 factor (ECF subfamily)